MVEKKIKNKKKGRRRRGWGQEQPAHYNKQLITEGHYAKSNVACPRTSHQTPKRRNRTTSIIRPQFLLGAGEHTKALHPWRRKRQQV